MKKKSISLVAIFLISMTTGASQIMAQKQDRVGKLLKLLSENLTTTLLMPELSKEACPPFATRPK